MERANNIIIIKKKHLWDPIGRVEFEFARATRARAEADLPVGTVERGVDPISVVGLHDGDLIHELVSGDRGGGRSGYDHLNEDEKKKKKRENPTATLK